MKEGRREGGRERDKRERAHPGKMRHIDTSLQKWSFKTRAPYLEWAERRLSKRNEGREEGMLLKEGRKEGRLLRKDIKVRRTEGTEGTEAMRGWKEGRNGWEIPSSTPFFPSGIILFFPSFLPSFIHTHIFHLPSFLP